MIAYHSALELHGYAYTEGYDVQVVAPGEPRMFEASALTCRFVSPPRGFTGPNVAATDGVTVVDRLGLNWGWIKAAVLAIGICNRRDWRMVSTDTISCDPCEFRSEPGRLPAARPLADGKDIDAWTGHTAALCREGLAFCSICPQWTEVS